MLAREGWVLSDLVQKEPDAGLGNGGLGRLAACFIDSLATMQYSAIGYGLRYEYGIFRQSIRNGYQVEEPDNWLRQPDPWEIRRGKRYPVRLGASIELEGSTIRIIPNRPSTLIGVAYDRPVAGYGARAVNTLRLWAAAAPSSFDFAEFSQGDFVGRRHPERARGVAHARALPGRLDGSRADAALPPGVLPRELLAAGHRHAFPAGGRSRVVRPAGPRRDPAERHASRRSRWPS